MDQLETLVPHFLYIYFNIVKLQYVHITRLEKEIFTTIHFMAILAFYEGVGHKEHGVDGNYL